MWDEAWLSITTRYLRSSVNICDASDRSLVWVRSTPRGEECDYYITEAGMGLIERPDIIYLFPQINRYV